MKTFLALLCWLICIVGISYLGTRIIRHVHADGFDAGRADVIGQLHNCVESNDNQWVCVHYPYYLVEGTKMIQEPWFEYTNRFFTNWVLRVRQP